MTNVQQIVCIRRKMSSAHKYLSLADLISTESALSTAPLRDFHPIPSYPLIYSLWCDIRLGRRFLLDVCFSLDPAHGQSVTVERGDVCHTGEVGGVAHCEG